LLSWVTRPLIILKDPLPAPFSCCRRARILSLPSSCSGMIFFGKLASAFPDHAAGDATFERLI
jgi:hypothetical protein